MILNKEEWTFELHFVCAASSVPHVDFFVAWCLLSFLKIIWSSGLVPAFDTLEDNNKQLRTVDKHRVGQSMHRRISVTVEYTGRRRQSLRHDPQVQ